ncbi:MAG TPA: cytochrome c [Candidatus Acidoferrum sp.]|jgi:polyvinyl alcohol dehydrogenase (cytochrome)|nr:cytochrome c [Candidatus Acidoferrum sp.]
MRVVARVPGLSFLIFFAVIFGSAAKAPRQETTANKAGEALYRQRCAACHEGAVPRAPNRDALKQMSPENVRFALLGGSMAVEGLGLSSASRRNWIQKAAPGFLC